MTNSQGNLWPAVFPEPWASDWGKDALGLWMGFTFRGVRYGMRWIKPGSFLMGSPADEPGRYNDETQHEVILTQGFWMGETTVTQALWQAVMDENPSHFKGAELPVDSVSWNACQTFLGKLHARYPELKLRLPTEAEWEYTCRAGTTTAYHFGETITTEQVNYDGNYPNEGSPTGSYRQTTVAVRALPANAWGLYQMHGNVREWCADRYGDYAAGHQIDPAGPDSGHDRVLRGGAWGSLGRVCRSAFRGGDSADVRLNWTGFRLARGH